MTLLKTVKHFDTMACIHAALLAEVHEGSISTPRRRYAMTPEADSYFRMEDSLFARLNTAVGYSWAYSGDPIGPNNQQLPLNEREGGVNKISWLAGEHDDNGVYRFTPFVLDHTTPHVPVHYNPESIEVVVVFTAASSDDPKAGFLVTELQASNDDYTRDWVIKQRPDNMSQNAAFKLVRFKGRCTIIEAACWIHLMRMSNEEDF